MPATYNVPVHVCNEYYDEGPTHARIVLDDKLIARLFLLQKVVKEHKFYAAEDWDVTPDLLKGSEDDGGEEEWGGSTDCMVIKVTDDSFFWEWFIKNTDVRCESESIDFKDLKEQIKENDWVMRAKKSDLPRLAVLEAPAKDSLKYKSSRELVEKRLKGE